MVSNCYTEEYDLMCATEKIGTFIVRYSEKGRKFKIVLDVDLSGRGTYAKLYVLQHDNIIDDEGVRFWISHRVMPRNRINGGKLLQSMGISEYDQYAILKYNNGYCGRDYFWVKFSPELTFYNVNRKAELIMSMQTWLVEDLRNRKLNNRVG